MPSDRHCHALVVCLTRPPLLRGGGCQQRDALIQGMSGIGGRCVEATTSRADRGFRLADVAHSRPEVLAGPRLADFAPFDAFTG